ncbi:hypothetical protein L3Q82_019277, partial [Scortum barcoo]
MTLLSLPREGLCQGTGEENSADSQSNLGFRRIQVQVFIQVVEHWTSSIASTGCLRVYGKFAQPVHMCFVDLEKAFDHVPKRGILWGVLHQHGVRGPFASAVWSLVRPEQELGLLHCRQQDLQQRSKAAAPSHQEESAEGLTLPTEKRIRGMKQMSLCRLSAPGHFLSKPIRHQSQDPSNKALPVAAWKGEDDDDKKDGSLAPQEGKDEAGEQSLCPALQF